MNRIRLWTWLPVRPDNHAVAEQVPFGSKNQEDPWADEVDGEQIW